MNGEGQTLTSVAVFCGSSGGIDPIYLETARATGRWLAERGIKVVYGGGHVGLMGAVADAALAAGGHVIGVIPRSLVDRELAHPGLSELQIVDSMHTRKAAMSDQSDAFIALPGGAGTLEEITEQWTWAQLGYHRKPCGYLDVDGFYAPLTTLIASIRDRGFMSAEHANMIMVSDDLAELVAKFEAYQPPPAKWTPPTDPPLVP